MNFNSLLNYMLLSFLKKKVFIRAKRADKKNIENAYFLILDHRKCSVTLIAEWILDAAVFYIKGFSEEVSGL